MKVEVYNKNNKKLGIIERRVISFKKRVYVRYQNNIYIVRSNSKRQYIVLKYEKSRDKVHNKK